MTEEMLRKRIADLQAQREQLLANLNAMQGAIIDCEFWLSELTKAKEQSEK